MEDIENEKGDEVPKPVFGITEKLVFAIFSICILTILIIFGWSAVLLVLELETGGGVLGSIARTLQIARLV